MVAAAAVAFVHGGHRGVRTGAARTSSGERAAARGECGAAVLGAVPDDGLALAQRIRGGPVRLASAARGIRGVDHGTQGRSQRFVFSAGPAGVRAAGAAGRSRPHVAGGRPDAVGFDGEIHPGRAAVPAAAAGFLAPGPRRRNARAGRLAPVAASGGGKNPVVFPVGGFHLSHAGHAWHLRRRTGDGLLVGPAGAGGAQRRRLSGKNVLAGGTDHPEPHGCAGLDSGRLAGAGGTGRPDVSGLAVPAAAALRAGRLALVFGRAAAGGARNPV